MLSPALLTTETSLVLMVDYQQHVMDTIHSHDHELIELNGPHWRGPREPSMCL